MISCIPPHNRGESALQDGRVLVNNGGCESRPRRAPRGTGPNGPVLDDVPMPLSAKTSPAAAPATAAEVATFTFPNRILFGVGSRRRLAGELARLGVSRPLVVTDAGLDAS